jgi:CO dehydrogenase/acetyl-CoA synthase gamma subunit (corrinoid Fe-S protein)
MVQLTNAMEIFKILPRTNCRDCGVPTCLAFAAAVFKGENRLADCSHIDEATLETFSVQNSDSRTLEREQAKALGFLRQKIAEIDLS